MKKCACPVAYGQVSVGAPCTPCPEGTYRVAMGTGMCTVCPIGTNSSVGSDELTDCTCIPGYVAASDGLECTACAAGTYKLETDTHTCGGTCPTGTLSEAGSSTPTDCKCKPGYTAASEGTACGPCAPGTYKNETGPVPCHTCPPKTSSASASEEQTDCTCVVGYTSGSDGTQCDACGEGTYKDVTGAFVCSTCPVGTGSPTGSDAIIDCTCMVGYEGDAGAVCTICPVDTYCVDGTQISCPENAQSVAGSDAPNDCVCNIGFFR
ncbi:hypothetical protein T484DRAFT_1648965 [Baffinella frigidus]|nr:hypothetical protein T484DRAFT_1648965 [Cryptophyta sp. CCMP2293]